MSSGRDPCHGRIIHRDQLHMFDLDGYRLNWRPDNTARVTRIQQDTTGFVRCSAASCCGIADICAFGKPHPPRDHGDEPSRCYDHKPYIPGGVLVWAESAGDRK